MVSFRGRSLPVADRASRPCRDSPQSEPEPVGRPPRHVDQDSTGVSKEFNFQNMLQVETPPANAAVTQNQTGPFQCCTNQARTRTTCSTCSSQRRRSRPHWLPGDGQPLDENGVLVTSGHGHIGQFADQHGTTQPNNRDTTGGGCIAETAIVNGVITTPPRTAPSPAVEENPRRNTTNANDRLTTDSGALGRV
jgi:hypothetical protein